jgi:hypothetical protein
MSVFKGQTMKKGVPVIVSDGMYEYEKMAIIVPTIDITADMMEQVIEDCNENKWSASDEVYLELASKGWVQIYPAAELCYNDYYDEEAVNPDENPMYFYTEGRPVLL